MHMERSEESFTTIFRHWGQNLPSDFQLELLQKPRSKDIGGFDPRALTSHATVNPWQPEVIFSLVSPKRLLGSKLPFSQLLQRRGLVSSRCSYPSAMGSTLPSTSWFLFDRGEGSPFEAVMLLFPVSQSTEQAAGDTGEETHLQREKGMQRLP